MGELSITLPAFRALPEYFLQEAEILCESLLLSLQPQVQLETVQDSFTDCRAAQSFVRNPANGLRGQYFRLVQAATLDPQYQLISEGAWRGEGIHQYLVHHEQLLEFIAGVTITTGRQMPRLKELQGIEYTNSASTERAIYIYQATLLYLIRHNKSKWHSRKEFIIARFLPPRAGRILFLYLVYIRPFAEMLCREQGFQTCSETGNQLLFWSLLQRRAWTPKNFYHIITTATQKVWGQTANPRQYRQLSIGITEKHVRGAQLAIDLTDDTTPDANPDVVYAWQSGHRPRERAQTYGLDGAFPTKLQPALLRAYARASHAWHEFLQLRGNAGGSPPLTSHSGPGRVAPDAIHPARATGGRSHGVSLARKRPVEAPSDPPGSKRTRPLSVAHQDRRPAATPAVDSTESILDAVQRSSSLPGEMEDLGPLSTPATSSWPREMEDPGLLSTPAIAPHETTADPDPGWLATSWPPFLRILPEYRVILCTTHDGCYTRQNLPRHLAEDHRIKLRHREQILAHPLLVQSELAMTPVDV
ncbi:hypothetical protein BDW75DRAFT_245912, partial [Aspergillus navahoensis]